MLGETMMLLNQNRSCKEFGDSVMERLKQAVVEHELTFRNQVRELHRLYWTQKNLMNELSRARKGGHAADWNARCALVKNHQRSFNLQLPADDFIAGSEDEHEESPNIKGSPFGVEHGRRLQEQKPHVSCVGIYLAGFDDFSVSAVNDLSSNKHGSRPALIDLNLTHEDDEPCLDQIHHVVTDSSIVRREILDPEPADVCPDKFSFAQKPDSANPAAKTSCEKRGEWLFLCGRDAQAHGSQDSLPTANNGKDSSDNGNRMDTNFLASGKENVDSPSAHSDSKRQDSNITTCNSINLPEKMTRDSTDKLSDLDGSEYDTLSSHTSAPDEAQEDALLKQFSVGCNSNGISSKIESSSCKKGAAEPAALSITDNSVITLVHSPKHEISYTGITKLGEHDVAIAAAAEALMTISFGRPVINLEQHDNTELAELQCKGRNDQLQHSSDSFEFMTMHLSEALNEENLMTTEIPSFSERGKEESRIRMRRGRRLRDFQKEILPGLVPLSRHEICEDMYSIGYKLRKNTATSSRGYCFVPARRWRSRLSSGRGRS